MIVKGQKINQETVEWFTNYILRQKEPFTVHEMKVKAIEEDVPRAIARRFVERLFQKLRKAGKIRFAAGYWLVVGA